MKNSITKQIESGYADLRRSEKQAADYILEHLEQVADEPIDRLARAAGVSQPTILRMLKSLGYKGYKDSLPARRRTCQIRRKNGK